MSPLQGFESFTASNPGLRAARLPWAIASSAFSAPGIKPSLTVGLLHRLYRQSHQSRSVWLHQSVPIGWPSGGSLALVRFIFFGSSWKRFI